MMKNLAFFFVFLLNGCSWSTFYFPVAKAKGSFPKLLDSQKKEITYSVSVSGGNPLFTKQREENELRKIWKENLAKLHLFKRVRYAFPSEKSKYHFHFMYIYGGSSPQETDLALSIYIGTLGIFPSGWHMTLDVVMTAYLDGQEVYSIVASTKRRLFFWLPLLVCLPVTIPLSSANAHRDQDYLMKMIIDNKLYDLDNFSKHI